MKVSLRQLKSGTSIFLVKWHFYFDRNGHFYGNKKLADGSKHMHVYHYSALWAFLAMIEDYESMLMLVTPKLANVPVESVTAYIHYKKMKKEPYYVQPMMALLPS